VTLSINENQPIHLVFLYKKKVGDISSRKKVIVLSGPTATGKTDLSLEIADILGGEIISADSMQVYREMNIGTAKVTLEEQKRVPHHLIDIRNVNESFNVAEFYTEAHKALKDILMRGKVPIVVGGTGFYLHAFLYGPPPGPTSSPEVRQYLEEQIKERGVEALYQKLSEIDPDYAKQISKNDRHKIVRALEIITITKKKVSDFPKPEKTSEHYDFRCWFIYYPKEILYPRIEMRCDAMIQSGFIEEVRHLEKKGLRENNSASQAIGYRQCLEYLDTEQTDEDFEEFIWNFKRASRQYAKRQFTWFRKEKDFRWLNLEEQDLYRIQELIIQDYEQS